MEQKVGSAYIDIEAKLDKLEWRLSTEIRSVAQRGGQQFTEWFSQALTPLKWMIASMVSVGVFSALAKEVVTLADNLEQANIAFTTMLGSEEKAIAMLQDLSEFAKKTPFELTDVRQNAKQLLAMGVSAENIIPTLKALWDAAAGTGADMTRLAMNYGQVITQGHLTGRELRDFLVNGIPLLDELAKNAGKSKEEIQNMISAGEISANDVTKAFETMTSAGGRFEDLMYKQSSTLTGLWSNFQDQLAQMGERIWAELLPTLKEAITGFSDWIEANSIEIEYFAGQIGDTIVTLAQLISDRITELWEDANILWAQILDWLDSISDKNSDTVSALQWDWHDLIVYIQLGIVAIVNAVNIGIKAIWNFGKAVVKAPLNMLNTAGAWVQGAVDYAANTLNWFDTSHSFDGFNKAKDEFMGGFKLDVKDLVDTFKEWGAQLESQLTDVRTNGIIRRGNAERKANEKVAKEKMKQDLQVLEARKKNWEALTKQELSEIENLKKAIGWLNSSFTYWDTKHWGWDKGSNKEVKKLAQEEKKLLKETEKAYEDIDKAIDKHNKNIEKAQEQVEKLNKKYQDLRQSVLNTLAETKNAIQDIDGQIAAINKDEDEKMIERYQKNQDKIKDMERKNKRIWYVASLKKLDEWRDYKDEKWDSETKTKDIIEYLETKEELSFITSLLSEAQLKEAETTARMTEAEKEHLKFLEKRQELEYKKAAALEKQGIAQAFLNQKASEEIKSEDDVNFKIEKNEQGEIVKAFYRDEKGALQEVVDFKNIQYLQDLTNKMLQIETEKKLQKDKIDEEKRWIEEYDIDRRVMEQNWTILLTNEVNKQKGVIQGLIEKYQALARAKASAGMWGARAFGWDVQAGVPYLVGENYKPEVFVPSTSGSVVPVNNYNQSRSYHFSWVTVNANNPQDFFSQMQDFIWDYT